MFIGDPKVGKTNIINRLIDKPFNDLTDTTTTFDTIDKELVTETKEKDGSSKEIKCTLNIMDSPGLEIYNSLLTFFLRKIDNDVVCLVYDITQRSSFESIKNKWIDLVRNESRDPKIFLIGNKNDMHDKEQVTESEAKDLAEKYGIEFILISAKDDYEINYLLERIIYYYKDEFIQYPEKRLIGQLYHIITNEQDINLGEGCCDSRRAILERRAKERCPCWCDICGCVCFCCCDCCLKICCCACDKYHCCCCRKKGIYDDYVTI